MTGRILAVLAAGLFTAACGAEPYDFRFLAGAYGDVQRGAFRYAGADRDFETHIVGNPFDVPKAVTEAALIDAMRGRDKGMNTNFTTTPRNPYRPYRIVMAFNPGRGIRVLCRDPGAAQSSLGGSRVGGKRLYLAAVFCDDTELMFAVGGSMPPLRTPRHPAFRRTVDRLMHHFVPFESMIDEIDDDDDSN